ncbi:MAG TPA: exodeoxyribonuclease VII small subunit [Propionicimonas sp.]|jgi:exodeoxyribonuclease VII small subunit|nr:exodeoxyribonuclease VII small subunit [Propionicimonas sp.]
MSESPETGYEQARDQLVEIVRRLEAGSVPLSESMALWERGEQLAATCQQWLDGARARIEAARNPGAGGESSPDAPNQPERERGA